MKMNKKKLQHILSCVTECFLSHKRFDKILSFIYIYNYQNSFYLFVAS